MNYFFKLRTYVTVSAWSLIVLSTWAAEGPITISSLGASISRYVEAPWFYKNPSLPPDTWFELFDKVISAPIISSDQLATVFNATNAAMAEELHNPEHHWYGEEARDDFLQRVIVPADSVVAVFGDVHGSAHSLLRSLQYLITQGYLNDDFTFRDPRFYLVFLGDYVDRGAFSPEVLYILMRLKFANPAQVFLVLGNHDTVDNAEITPTHWKDDMRSRYADEAGELITQVAQFFSKLPKALYLGTLNGNGGIDYMIFAHAGVNVAVDSHDFLVARDSVYFYAGGAWPVYRGGLPQSPYMWTYITEEEVRSATNHVLTFGEVNRWLSRVSREGVCVHALIRGHQHGGRDSDPQLEEGHGYAAYENVHTISSCAGAGGVFLPYDSFLLLHTATAFPAWTGEHIFRQVGYTERDVRAFFTKLKREFLPFASFGFGELHSLTSERKKATLEDLTRWRMPFPLDYPAPISGIPWRRESIVLSDRGCIAEGAGSSAASGDI